MPLPSPTRLPHSSPVRRPSDGALLRAAFASMGEAVLVVDGERRVVRLSGAAEALLGLGEAEALGRRCCEVLGLAEEGCSRRCPAQAALQSGQRSLLSPLSLRPRPAGVRREVALAAYPVVEQDGAATGALIVLTPLGDAGESGEMPALGALISHEMSARLSSISASAELLIGLGVSSAEYHDLLETIRSQSARLASFFDSLISVERLQSGAVQALSEPVAVLPVVRRVVAAISAKATEHRFAISASEPLPLARGDEDKTEAVLHNLIENAAKYSSARSEIRVSAGLSDDGNVIISVQDEGVGIPQEELANIYQRFHRVYRSGTPRKHGHGLGLYIAKGFVEAQGGRLWAESQVGKGSTFYFTLPPFEDDLLT